MRKRDDSNGILAALLVYLYSMVRLSPTTLREASRHAEAFAPAIHLREQPASRETADSVGIAAVREYVRLGSPSNDNTSSPDALDAAAERR